MPVRVSDIRARLKQERNELKRFPALEKTDQVQLIQGLENALALHEEVKAFKFIGYGQTADILENPIALTTDGLRFTASIAQQQSTLPSFPFMDLLGTCANNELAQLAALYNLAAGTRNRRAYTLESCFELLEDLFKGSGSSEYLHFQKLEENLREAIRTNALQLVRTTYSWKTIWGDLLARYQELEETIHVNPGYSGFLKK